MRSTTNGEAPVGAQKTLDWKAALWAGIIAGIVFMMMEMGLVALSGMGGFWAPPRMIAAMVLGPGVLPPPESFDAVILMTAMMVHMMLSIAYGFLLGWIIGNWRMTGTIAPTAGAAFGFAIYVVNFHGIAPAIFPWFVMAQNWVSVVSHIAFGLVLGWAYKSLSHA